MNDRTITDRTISVIGLGYIGLPTAAVLANRGYKVVGFDVSQFVVDTINRGEIHIIEPNLEELVRDSVRRGMLSAHTVQQTADVYIICVPTPLTKEGPLMKPDVEHVFAAATSIAHLLKPNDILIVESTCPIGTTDKITDIIQSLCSFSDQIHVAYCPERVLPGNTIEELVSNDRVVGGVNKAATRVVKEFYNSFVNGSVAETDAKTAEMCKLAENSFRDVNIAFANELSLICDEANINVWDLIRLANLHPRVNILQPGTGVGGHCIAVDPWFVVAGDKKNSKLIQAARKVNLNKTKWVLERIVYVASRLEKDLKRRPKIACLGMSFKPDIDDFRESPAVTVIEGLIEAGADILLVEPNLDHHPSFDLVEFDVAMSEADLVTLLVSHTEFKTPECLAKLGECQTLDFCGIISCND